MAEQFEFIDELEAGTGFMLSISEVIKQLSQKGYSENLSAKRDHFEARSGELKLFPDEIVIDNIFRFENTSDPDDQSILYAVSSPAKGVKGLYVESFGAGQEELSREMIERLKNHPH